MTNTGAPWAPGLQDVITAVSLEIERGVDDTSAACRQQLSCEMSWHTAPSFWPGPLQPNTRNIYVLIMRALTAWRIYMASSFPKLLTGPLLIWILLSCTELKSRSLKKKKLKKNDAAFVSALETISCVCERLSVFFFSPCTGQKHYSPLLFPSLKIVIELGRRS